MLNYQLGACITGEGKISTLSSSGRSRAVFFPAGIELFNQTIQKLSQCVTQVFLAPTRCLVKYLGRLIRIMSIFEPINRPY